MTTLPIALPSGFKSLVEEGDTVKTGDKLAKRMLRTDVTYNIAEALNLPSRKVLRLIRKSPGDRIVPGDVLAERSGLLRTDKIISEVHGTLLRIERDSGTIVVKLEKPPTGSISDDIQEEKTEDGKIEYIVSPLDGTIALCNNEQIQIRTDKNVLAGADGCGENAEGEIFYVPPRDEGDAVLAHDVTSDAIGKVLVSDMFTRDVLMKAISIGAAGVIGRYIADEDLVYLVGKDLKTPVVSLDSDQYKKLLKHVGKKVYIDGATKTIILLNYES
jgi:hypothetical protein